ncbi:MAG: hypothetical protein LLG42_03400 [Chloroflexi bacterium]|nr:hypothetical protein [Chloroflexota bacterium]
MERTVPKTASEEIELYLRTIYSLLRSTTEVQIRTLEEAHANTNSSLHLGAHKAAPDMSAFIYSLFRLPACITQVRKVILGQSAEVFSRHGFTEVESWEPVSAPARRRRCFFDRNQTLACFIASRSDIDDLVPTLTAFQIEWNKLHTLLNALPPQIDLPSLDEDPSTFQELAESLQITADDLQRLKTIWGDHFSSQLQQIAANQCALQVRLLNGSLTEYWRSTRIWWDTIEEASPSLLKRPVYFISSNNHSIANLLSGHILKQRGTMLEWLKRQKSSILLEEWQAIQSNSVPSNSENFLYYLYKKFTQSAEGSQILAQQYADERRCAITRIPSVHSFEVDAQVIDLACLDPQSVDPRLAGEDLSFLHQSDALILNLDYPLGLAAYNILRIISEHVYPILGIYSIGKAATLNGVIGDVIIPDVVYDEHSQNTYLYRNVIRASDVTPFLVHGSALDHQKAISALGTFLQNADFMDVFYREGYTDIEMEAGPYLSAVSELTRPNRHPINEIVNLYDLPFDLGIVHYVSDTPLSKGKNLGAGTLSYYGVDSTYAASLAILQRILRLERQRING